MKQRFRAFMREDEVPPAKRAKVYEYVVYILKQVDGNETYCGSTQDIQTRLEDHNRGIGRGGLHTAAKKLEILYLF